MHKIWIFKEKEYRKALARKIDEEGNRRGYRSLLAQAAGCQPAYLSQVLRGSVHLTPEHAAGLCEFWNFSDLESEYFLTLVHLGRAGSKALEQHLKKSLENLRSMHEKAQPTQIQGASPTHQNEWALFYYLDWLPSAIHMLLDVPGHETSSLISKRLEVDEMSVLGALHVLESLGIALKESNRWKLNAKSLYASNESLFAPHHHRNWREKAVEYFRHGPKDANLHYTSVFSLNKETIKQVRLLLEKSVSTTRQQALASNGESIACLNIDWFEI